MCMGRARLLKQRLAKSLVSPPRPAEYRSARGREPLAGQGIAIPNRRKGVLPGDIHVLLVVWIPPPAGHRQPNNPRLQRTSDSLSCLSARIHSPCPRKSGPPPKQSASTSPDSSGNSLVTYVKHGPRISCNLSVSECCLPPVTSQRPSCLFTVVGDPRDPGSPFKGSHIFTSSWPGREAKARRLSQLRGNSFRSVRDREAGSVF